MSVLYDFLMLGASTQFLVLALTALLAYFVYNTLFGDRWANYGVTEGKFPLEALSDFQVGCHKLIQDHGDIVGTQRAGLMMLMTRDLDLLKHVMVKDFNNFVNRHVIVSTTSPIINGLFFLKDQDWRRMRHLLTPSFTTGKLKYASKAIEKSAQNLAKALENWAKKDVLVPAKHLNGQYASEIIASTGFGLQTNCIGDEDDEFTYHAKRIFKIRNRLMRFLMVFLRNCPRVLHFFTKTLKISALDASNKDTAHYLSSIIRSAVAERNQREAAGGVMPNDFLQSLIVAKRNKDIASSDLEHSNENELVQDGDLDHRNGNQVDSIKDLEDKSMTEEEMVGQSLMIIFAAFDTTSTTLQMLFYLLAKHQDVQEKVYEEIQRVITTAYPTYEQVGNLKYTEQVINETLRLYPPAPIMSRTAAEAITYNDITIPKGAVVFLLFGEVMLDPKNYPDPHKFDPERFSEENKAKRDPIAFCPFGYGGRQCIGMRLAYLELKFAIVHALRKVKFELNEKTEPKSGEDVQLKFHGFMIAKKPIMLAVKLR